jgi:DNA replication ATP-dependent helicase Dna2
MASSHNDLLAELLRFVQTESEFADAKLVETWQCDLQKKLHAGQTQAFTHLEKGPDAKTLWAYLDEGESRFREGDLVCLHMGAPMASAIARRLSFELEEDGRWLLRGKGCIQAVDESQGQTCYADPDGLNLLPYYEQALKEISQNSVGRDVILPLISGELEPTFNAKEADEAKAVAIKMGLNARQSTAVGLALGADHLTCIQGPPGTGKTAVLALIAKLLTDRGERVLVTSHTHMGINNALTKVIQHGIPTVKVSSASQRKGLAEQIEIVDELASWKTRPNDGYVVGATPFAACNARLKGWRFDTIIFDEASQVTVPLALMAMKLGKKFIFIGDQRQLPPVILSESVLSGSTSSVFARITNPDAEHCVMLNETYRMNRWLTQWPSMAFYRDELVSAGPNRERRLALRELPDELSEVLDPSHPGVFIPSPSSVSRNVSHPEAKLVAEICLAAVSRGVPIAEIGIVTPYRSQGRAIRSLLGKAFGFDAARNIVSDTVERMQGQERELIILSMTTGDQAYLSSITPFFFQPERLNVSITRPKTKLIVIGPDVQGMSLSDDLSVQAWVEQYANLVSQLHKVADVSAPIKA